MGVFTYSFGGASLIVLGTIECLSLKPIKTQSLLYLPSISTLIISILFIFNSFISIFDAIHLKDHTGFILQFETISIYSLFLLYSVLSLLNIIKKDSFFVPKEILLLIILFGFIEEFLLFYLQKKDPDGIENRYYDLFLLPIGICVFSTVLDLKKAEYARLARGIGLISQGTWLIQMGFSFYSNAIANGCYVVEKSRGNYSIKCKSHMEYHRGRAIATLQFNCQLAILVVMILGFYSVFCRKDGVFGEFDKGYKVLGAEMQVLDNFTLDSDDDFANNEVEIEKGIVVVTENENRTSSFV